MANRAVVRFLDEQGGETWKLITKEKPRASPGRVVVRLTVRPLNPSDTIALKTVPILAQMKEAITGNEGLGYVEEVGEGVTKFKVGQRVVPFFISECYLKGNGSWQDYVDVSADELFVVADNVPDEIAAQFCASGLTLYGVVKSLNLSKGEYLLQSGASSVMGRQVIQLAKHWGIKTINIVRRDEVKEELYSLGADHVINSTTEDVTAKVKEITDGKGADGAIDGVAGQLTKVVCASVKNGGMVLIYGFLGVDDIASPDFTVGHFDLGRVNVRTYDNSPFVSSPEKIRETFSEIIKLIEEGVLVPLVGKKFKLEEFEEAFHESRKSARGGRVMLVS